jgi:copper chaperone CopZ
MHCKSCAIRIEKVLGNLPGVLKAKANHRTKTLIVKTKEAVPEALIINALAEADYNAVLKEEK